MEVTRLDTPIDTIKYFQEMCSHLDKMLTESPECKPFADLEDMHSLGGNTISFPSILPITSKPDIAIVVLLKYYKTNIYSNIMHNIAGQGYNCKFLAIEKDSHEYVSEENKIQLASLFHK